MFQLEYEQTREGKDENGISGCEVIVETWHATLSKARWHDQNDDLGRSFEGTAEADLELGSIVKFLSVAGLVAGVEGELTISNVIIRM